MRFFSILLIGFLLFFSHIPATISQNNWKTFVSEDEKLSFDYPQNWSVSTSQENILYYLINEVPLTDTQLGDSTLELEPNQVVISLTTSAAYKDDKSIASNLDDQPTEFLLGYHIGLMHAAIIFDRLSNGETAYLLLSDVNVIEMNDIVMTYVTYKEKNDGLTAIVQIEDVFVVIQAWTSEGQLPEYEKDILDIIFSIKYSN